jgi:hypothetical protein
MCERCNSVGYLSVNNGDDDQVCPVCQGEPATVAQVEQLSSEAELIIFGSQLTLSEATAIVRHHNFGLNVTERLYTEALGVLEDAENHIRYILGDSAQDDERARDAQDEREATFEDEKWGISRDE